MRPRRCASRWARAERMCSDQCPRMPSIRMSLQQIDPELETAPLVQTPTACALVPHCLVTLLWVADSRAESSKAAPAGVHRG
eukprot:3467882-Prymnesium_polylepis.1